jgi:transposase
MGIVLMMGRLPEEQAEFFYEFCLDTYIPEDHLLRGIDRFLDFASLREHLKPHYSELGRPSVDPELMMRMLILGYCYGIRSERQLCEEVHFNLAYRWFCRLGLEGKVPDHSTFSKNRHGRFRDSEAFRYLFEDVLRRCMEEGLVRGEGFAVDASVVKADANRQRGVAGDTEIDWGDPDSQARPVREYLEALDEQTGMAMSPKNVSLTDPAARWTAATGERAFYAYSTNYLVDVAAGIIVDVEPTPAYRLDEVQATKTMIDRVEERLGIKPKKLIGDTAYGSAEMLSWIVADKGIEPYVSLWERGERHDGTFGRSKFTFDSVSDTYTCPGGKLLQRYRRPFKRKRVGIQKDNTIKYRASQLDCQACAMKSQCCPNSVSRKVTRSIYETARDVVRSLAQTPAYEQSRKDRKKVEVLFAHMKRILKMDRLRLRGLTGAKDEFLLTATVQNLRRMVKYLGTGPPRPLAAVVA